MEEMIKWLNGVGCSGVDTMVKEAIPKPGNPTFRKGEPGEWIIKFKPHHVEMAEELLGDIMETLGYRE